VSGRSKTIVKKAKASKKEVSTEFTKTITLFRN
jgi:hypothetical protein